MELLAKYLEGLMEQMSGTTTNLAVSRSHHTDGGPGSGSWCSVDATVSQSHKPGTASSHLFPAAKMAIAYVF